MPNLTPGPRCFVISPIGEKESDVWVRANKVLRHIIKATLEPEYVVDRADDSSNPGAITPQIVNSILKADLIVADISGGNANVFYELAIAHGYDKPTVHIQSVGNKVPFDIKDMRTIHYDINDLDSVEEAKQALAKAAKFAVSNPADIETPLKGAQAFGAVESSTDPELHVTSQVLSEVQQLRYELRTELFASDFPSRTRRTGNASDADSLRRLAARVGAAGRLRPTDFEGCITQSTTETLDAWLRQALKRVTGISDADELNEILFDDAVKGGLAATSSDDDAPF
ncbi:hypothetical protein GCM10023328_02130 [Modestobacter marinus]|uniref:Nucleoside 2-deoxyribosyltransferase n=1 Tax=Modestobacter marinus TaxID=477641 RepID=A0A846LV82_9ACTN|nr:hypothetical protein [Modestobacter marinus]NIH67359.1 hypothetical protein [Modestobacter marinus]GGL54233.1 hypothetical protein GCM10011589_07830 [Modestobacter marinus]